MKKLLLVGAALLAATGAAYAADTFAFTAAIPVIVAVSPNSGPAGTSVTILGSNFTGATAVDFGSTAATSFSVGNPNSITAVAPAGTGTVPITVTTPAGVSIPPN
jgi:IPT/TIG domain